MILAWGLIFLFPGAVLGLFSADPQILEQGIPACHVYFFGFFMMAFHMTGQNVFVPLGRYRQAIFFSLLRKAFVVVPLTLILPRVTDLGVRGVFLAEPISNFVSGVLCYASMALTLHYLVRKRQR